MRHQLIAGAALAVALAGVPAFAGQSPLELQYSVTDIGGGLFEYQFDLILDNGSGDWFAGQEFAWLIFGDQQSAPSPLTNFTMTSAIPGPWTSLASSSGFHNGPTFAPVLDPWIPTTVGETLHWSGTSDANLGQGELLFSSLVGTGNRPDFQVATLIPAPGAIALLGMAGLVARRRRRTSRAP